MREFKALLPKAIRQTGQYFKVSVQLSGPFLFAVFLGTFMLNAVGQSMISPVMDTTAIMGIVIMVVGDLLGSFLLLIVLPARILTWRQKRPLIGVVPLIKEYGTDMTSEMLRVASGMLFGLLMGIVPGILRSLRWMLVPYIVVADPLYAKGDRDALEQSAQITKGILFGLAVLWLGFFIIDTGFYQLDQIWWNQQKADSIVAWGGSLVINLVSTSFAIYSTLLYFAIYEIRRGHHEPNV